MNVGSLKVFGLLLAMIVMVCVVAAIGPGTAFGGKEKAEEPVNLTVKSLTVKGEAGTGSVSIVSTEDGPGIWLTAPNGDLICITALGRENGRSVCIMKKYADGFKSANVAMSMMSDGEGVIQFQDGNGGGINLLPMKRLSELVGK